LQSLFLQFSTFVVEVGALADLLLVDGNPREAINLLTNRGRNFVVIMKDGKVQEDTLSK
jgi:imidazolonepropionase-like amidohydrolase